MISIIVAIADNRAIGCKNTLPWHLPADFEYFKKNTLGKTLVMGLKTFQSVGSKSLPGRKTIILNNDPSYIAPENCVVAHSIEEVIKMAGPKGYPEKELMICGGASVYAQFLPLADRLYLTFIHHNFEADTFFPEFDINHFKEIKREDHKADDKNKFDYSFVVLEKR